MEDKIDSQMFQRKCNKCTDEPLVLNEPTGCLAFFWGKKEWDNEGNLCYCPEYCRFYDKDKANDILNQFCQNELKSRKSKFSQAYLLHGNLNHESILKINERLEENSLHTRGVKPTLTRSQKNDAIEAYAAYLLGGLRNTNELEKIARKHGVSVANLKTLYSRATKQK